MKNIPSPATKLLCWLLLTMTVVTCGVAWLAIEAGFASPAAPALTWVLSTETLPLALVAGSAWIIHLLWRSHHTWRQRS
jgi:hypothetical protein